MNWEKHWDSEYECYYYFNCLTGESTWEEPVDGESIFNVDTLQQAISASILGKPLAHRQSDATVDSGYDAHESDVNETGSDRFDDESIIEVNAKSEWSSDDEEPAVDCVNPHFRLSDLGEFHICLNEDNLWEDFGTKSQPEIKQQQNVLIASLDSEDVLYSFLKEEMAKLSTD